jgi:glucosyltransferase Lgt1/2/3
MQDKVAQDQTDTGVQYLVAKAAESNPSLWNLVELMQGKVAKDQTKISAQYLAARGAESNPRLWDLVELMQDKVAKDQTKTSVQYLVAKTAESNPKLWDLVGRMQDKVAQNYTNTGVQYRVAKAAESNPKLWDLVGRMQEKVAQNHTDTDVQYLVAKAAESNLKLWDLVERMQEKVSQDQTDTIIQERVAEAAEFNPRLWDLVELMQDKVAQDQTDAGVQYLVAKAAESSPKLWDLVNYLQDKVAQDQTNTSIQYRVARAAESNPKLWSLVERMQNKVAQDQTNTGVQYRVAKAAESHPKLWDLVEYMQDKVAQDQTNTGVQYRVTVAAEYNPRLWNLVERMQDKVAKGQTDTNVQFLIVNAAVSNPKLWNLVEKMQVKVAQDQGVAKVQYPFLVQMAFAAGQLQTIGIDSANRSYKETDTLSIGIDLETKIKQPMVPLKNQRLLLAKKEIRLPEKVFTSVLNNLQKSLLKINETLPVIAGHPILTQIFISCYRGVYNNALAILSTMHHTITNMYHQENLQHLGDLSWVTLRALHNSKLVMQDAFEVPSIKLAGQLLYDDYRYIFNTKKQTAFWFSTKTECFMPDKQQQKVIKKAEAFLEEGIEFKLGYSAYLLDESQQEAIQFFAQRHHINLLNIDEFIDKTTNPLWQVIKDELYHIKNHSGGNPAALSDACRMMPELISDGFYGDLDSPLRQKNELCTTVRGGLPIIFNMGSIVSDPQPPKWQRQEGVCINNDLIGYSGTQEDRMMRQKIASYILEGYKNPGKRVDLSLLKEMDINQLESPNIFELRKFISDALTKVGNHELGRIYKALVEDITGPGAIYNALGGVKAFTHIHRNGAILPTSSARALQFFMSCNTKSPVDSNNIPSWLTSSAEIEEMKLNEDGLSWMPTTGGGGG